MWCLVIFHQLLLECFHVHKRTKSLEEILGG